ncbi:hypothetical protein C5D07_04240 [Rathayibacter tritici]|uniref:class I SAM-dependent methyltransferase n=2 Tax=Rathayibacter tritici TaxID=33888 RepID=UPI000CE815D3|nr:class I SAM-dependent methyltransferase [Rathayibacter tritici]PPF30569.1 hypothetical protein C5C06_04845 [Rathayibacter tritici]PPI17867.1 hypothetical protein C5D07_04240 [Rathayibacter tritici]
MSADTTGAWVRTGDPSIEFVADEICIRDELTMGDFDRWRCGDSLVVFHEPLLEYPERLFVFEVDGQWYAGIKTISDYVVDDDMPGVFCSRIRWFNIIGRLHSLRTSDSDARLVAAPLGIDERRRIYDAMQSTTAVTFPFPKYSSPGTEKSSPPDGWKVSRERADFLALGERHIRAFTRSRFAGYPAPVGRAVVAYDPACSTGRFLSEFAASAPFAVYTIGQDLSRQMVSYSAELLDEAHHGDAANPVPTEGSVDILFIRFLNSEVVTTVQAREILPRLVATLRLGGTAVLLGHTPILLDIADLAAAGLTVIQTLARQEDAVFPYVVAERAR